MDKALSNYYDIAKIVKDDIEMVALLVQVVKLKPNANIVRAFEELRLSNFREELEAVLDLKISTIRDLEKIFKEKQDGSDSK